MGENEYNALLRAIERNTSATRSIAIFLFGGVIWFLAGATSLGLGLLWLTVNPYDPEGGIFLAGVGSVLIFVGAVWSIAGALKELAKSRQ